MRWPDAAAFFGADVGASAPRADDGRDGGGFGVFPRERTDGGGGVLLLRGEGFDLRAFGGDELRGAEDLRAETLGGDSET